MTVETVGHGVYRVTLDGSTVSVYIAGTTGRRWAFLNGRVYRETPRAAPAGRTTPGPDGPQAISAPMPATVIKVLATPGATVKKGETLVVLEAMKMELPLRATADGLVAAVHCQEGQLVSPDAVLVELQ